MKHRFVCAALAVALGFCSALDAGAVNRREISYQSKADVFADYYVGPNPSGTAAAMYISPLPTPPHVGHTYTTYQPWMPHEYLYEHKRSHYAYTRGSGWSRAKVRYGSAGLRVDHFFQNVRWPY